jgi:hypothetical protein
MKVNEWWDPRKNPGLKIETWATHLSDRCWLELKPCLLLLLG